jgi:hypothetical protein
VANAEKRIGLQACNQSVAMQAISGVRRSKKSSLVKDHLVAFRS